MLERLAILVLAVCLLPSLAFAAGQDYGRVVLLSGWTDSDGGYQGAIRFSLNPSWKTYWRLPGESGIPLSLDWEGSSNIRDVEVVWPQPEVFEAFGLTSIGYTGTLILPMRFVPMDASRPIDLNMQVEFGVCSDICVPASVRFAGPIGFDGDATTRKAIRDAIASGPVSPTRAGMQSVACNLIPVEGGFGLRTTARYSGDAPENQIILAEYDDPDIWIASAMATAEGQILTGDATLDYYGSGPMAFERELLNISIVGPRSVVEIDGCRM